MLSLKLTKPGGFVGFVDACGARTRPATPWRLDAAGFYGPSLDSEHRCLYGGRRQAHSKHLGKVSLALHTKKRRRAKIAISVPKTRRAIRRSFHVMPTRASANGIEKRKATHARAASSHRGNDASHHRGIAGTIGFSGKGALVIPGQLFVSLRHRSDWRGFAVGASSIER